MTAVAYGLISIGALLLWAGMTGGDLVGAASDVLQGKAPTSGVHTEDATGAAPPAVGGGSAAAAGGGGTTPQPQAKPKAVTPARPQATPPAKGADPRWV